MLLRLISQLAQLNIRSTVANLSPEPGIQDLFKEGLIQLNISPSLHGASHGTIKLHRVIRKLKPDLVQGWMYHSNLIALAATRSLLSHSKSRPALVWNVRRGLDDLLQRSVRTRVVVRTNALTSRLADSILYCSRATREQHEAYGFYRGSGAVIDNGFDTERFKPDLKMRCAFRLRYGIADDEVVIGNVGRYDIAKGHLYLVRAFKQVRERFSQARLVLVGRGIDESNLELVAELRALGCLERTLLLGAQESIENLYAGFDIYCSASICEGFPNALSEAMACGAACIATDTGASRQLVEGVGVVVASRDVNALAEAMIATLSAGSSSRLKRGAAGRERVKARYGLEGIAKRYLEHYQGVLAKEGVGQGANDSKATKVVSAHVSIPKIDQGVSRS